MSMQIGFYRLNLDLWEKIFKEVELEDLGQLPFVCKGFKNLCQSETIWRVQARQLRIPIQTQTRTFLFTFAKKANCAALKFFHQKENREVSLIPKVNNVFKQYVLVMKFAENVLKKPDDQSVYFRLRMVNENLSPELIKTFRLVQEGVGKGDFLTKEISAAELKRLQELGCQDIMDLPNFVFAMQDVCININAYLNGSIKFSRILEKVEKENYILEELLYDKNYPFYDEIKNIQQFIHITLQQIHLFLNLIHHVQCSYMFPPDLSKMVKCVHTLLFILFQISSMELTPSGYEILFRVAMHRGEKISLEQIENWIKKGFQPTLEHLTLAQHNQCDQASLRLLQMNLPVVQKVKLQVNDLFKLFI